MDIRTDRVGVLLDQLEDAFGLSMGRIGEVDSVRFLHRPTPDAWSIVLRSEARTPDAYGPGDHVLDMDHATDPFGPGPLSTIAWKVGHLVSGFAGRYEWTFGGRQVAPDRVVVFSPDPADMFGQLQMQVGRWTVAVGGMSDDELDVPGFGQYPWGLDPEIPFIGIVRWMNREAIHHLAEIALQLDLYDAAEVG